MTIKYPRLQKLLLAWFCGPNQIPMQVSTNSVAGLLWSIGCKKSLDHLLKNLNIKQKNIENYEYSLNFFYKTNNKKIKKQKIQINTKS